MTKAIQNRVSDQRAKPRVPLVITATISVPNDKLVLPCLVTDLSASGAGLQYEDIAPGPEKLGHLDIAEFGRFQGYTIRQSGQIRGFKFAEGEARRENLTAKLIAFVARGVVGIAEERRKHPRSAGNTDLVVTLPSGASECCQVLDISLEGLSLSTKMRPALGHLLRVGHLYARVVNHREDGIGMKFVHFVGI